MPIETDLNVPPYYDDYDANKDFYKVLFKPSVSVQARELNQLQTYGQVQVERFADNIFKRGTIVDGCNFLFHPNYSYVKIRDVDIDGDTVIPALYHGMFAKSSSNLQAYIINYQDGFESAAPDLKTLYVTYRNSGESSEANGFIAGETLTIYDANTSIFRINVENGGVSFSNSDTLVVTSAAIVKMGTGSFTNGEYVVQPSTGANLQIVEIDSTSLVSTGQIILRLKPRNVDLANATSNSTNWTFSTDEEIINASNTSTGIINGFVGEGTSGRVITSGTGRVLSVILSDRGYQYTTLPTAVIRSVNNSSGISSLVLNPENYYAKVAISPTSNSVGKGYAFGVTEGIIYQKGHFVRVAPQTIIVEKYNQTPNAVAVGFKTNEEIVTYLQDDSLTDNATGSPNETAPGADRLKLTPELTVSTVADASANEDFFTLVEWSEGNPYKQNRVTQYNRIGDEMSQRTFDESGNFVIDTFQVSTASTSNVANEGKYYTVYVDPGQAYISGAKVQTLRNYQIDVLKGLDTKSVTNIISFNYGNFVRVKEVGGLFQFSTGDIVSLYTLPKGFLSNTAAVSASNTSPLGTNIGSARMRSMTLESGVAGDPNAVYRIYLFDLNMNVGKNFRDARSLHYNSTNPGIADLVTEIDATTSANIAVIKESGKSKLVFPAGVESLKKSANTTYTYRTIDQTTTTSNSGVITKSIAVNPSEFFPYTGGLTTSQLKDLYVVPVGNTLYQYSNLVGNATVSSTSAVVTGIGTNFFADFEPGDYIYVFEPGSGINISTRRVKSITNTTSLIVDSNVSFSNTGSAKFKRAFPRNVPVPFGTRTGLSANVDANGNILTLRFAHSNGLSLTFEGTASVNTAVGVNIERRNVTSTSKTANRLRHVKLNLSSHNSNTVGPWSLGVPDIFRLRGVFVSNSATVNTNSTNITSDFYVDHNQTFDALLGSWLYRKPRSRLSLNSTDHLLVVFDYFTRADDGYFDTVSYLNTSNTEQIAALDSLPLANLTTSACSWEVPEIYSAKGDYADLLNHLDFRPAVTSSVSPSTNSTSAPTNPSIPTSYGNTADPANDKKFPLPDSSATSTIEHYQGRIDNVFISGSEGNIYVLKGIPDTDPRKRYEPNHPKDSLKLQVISVPPYPNISDTITKNVSDIIKTNISNEKVLNLRLKTHVISAVLTSLEFQLSQPMVYTMEDIGNLERRIKDLEYYVSLSILETSITNKPIPSSIDGTLNRFKFGFFADDFSSEVYSDVENPQYAASIEVEGDTSYGISKSPLETENSWANSDKTSPTSTLLSPAKIVQKRTNRIVPPKFIWSIPHHTENLGYVDHVLLEQNYATVSNPVVVNLPGITVSNCVPVVLTGNSTVTQLSTTNGYFYTSYNSLDGNPNANEIEQTQTVNFGIFNGTARLYFHSGTGFIDINVYQGANLVASSNASANIASALTATQQSFLTTNALSRPFYNIGSYPLDQTFTRGVNTNHHKGAGSLSWSHTASRGRDYTIVVGARTGLYNYKYLLEYPAVTSNTSGNTSAATTIVNPCIPIGGTPPVEFRGTISFGRQAGRAWSCSKLFAINGISHTVLAVTATGLKPNTRHYFYVDGIDQSHQVALATGRLGVPIIVGPTGQLTFNYYLPIFAHNPKLIPDGGVDNIALQEHWLQSIFTGFRNGTTYGSSGYSTFEVKGDNSSATILVAQRKPQNYLPFNPAGNP